MTRNVAAVLGLGLAIGVGLFERAHLGGRKHEEPERRDVILITVDTLRADHLGAYGYPKQTSPSIDELGRRALLFWNAYCAEPKTSPSFASIMTGLHPARHRVKIEGHLDDRFSTLAEVFSAHGYETAAVVDNANLSKASGFAQGFQSYRIVWKRYSEKDLSALTIARLGLDFLEAPHSRPFFLWMHFIDPHAPYIPPAALVRYDPAADRGRDIKSIRHRIVVGTRNERKIIDTVESHEGYFTALYDAEIRLVDQQVGRLLTLIDARHPQAVVMFASDHGEELGEHNLFFEHGPLCQESSTRVPLMLSIPGNDPRVIDEPVSLLDIFPTLLETVLHERPSSDLDGVSLLDPQEERQLVIQAHDSHAVLAGRKLGVVMDDRRTMNQLGLEKFTGYDITRPLALRAQSIAFLPDVFHDFETRYKAFNASHPLILTDPQDAAPLPQDDIEELKELGYIE